MRSSWPFVIMGNRSSAIAGRTETRGEGAPMRNSRRLIPVLLLVLLLGALPAYAGAWRSSTGNIFRFQSNGNCSFLGTNGQVLNGRWWWYNQSAGVFQYQFFGGAGVYQVQMHNNYNATVYGGSGVTYWSRLAGRGGEDEDNKDHGAESGWFMVRETP